MHITMPCGCEADIKAHIEQGTHYTNDPHRSEAFVESVELPERALRGRLLSVCPSCWCPVDADEVVALCQRAFEVSHA